MAQAAPLDRVATGGDTPRAPAWAWGLCWLMFVSTVLNYMDRQAVALVGPSLRAEFGLSAAGFGWVQAAFYLTYALFQVPAGYLADRWSVRTTYAAAVALWSLAGIAAAFAPTLGILLACRALLGIGESFNWPCALRATATVLPRADRGLGNGIFNSGAAVGAVVTPLTVPWLAAKFGWRAAFAVVGALGFVWVVLWLLPREGARALDAASKPVPESEPGASRGLSAMARLTFAMLAAAALFVSTSAYWFGARAVWWAIALLMIGPIVAAGLTPLEALGTEGWARDLGEVARLRRFWVLAVVSISVNVSWHFQVNWMGMFFQEERRLGLLAGGMVSAIPFLAADFGNLGGGAVSRLLARRGLSPSTARLCVVAAGALLISCGTSVGAIGRDAAVLAVLSLMALGTAAYMANYFAYCQEVSARRTGLVVGILGGLGNLFAAGFLPIAGKMKDLTGSLGPSFVVAGLLPLVGVAALAVGWGRESKPS